MISLQQFLVGAFLLLIVSRVIVEFYVRREDKKREGNEMVGVRERTERVKIRDRDIM